MKRPRLRPVDRETLADLMAAAREEYRRLGEPFGPVDDVGNLERFVREEAATHRARDRQRQTRERGE